MQLCVRVVDVEHDLHRELEEEELLQELGRPGFFLQSVDTQSPGEMSICAGYGSCAGAGAGAGAAGAAGKGTPPGGTCSAGRRAGS